MKSLQLEKPHAIIVIGIQGSGKSFFAGKFSDTFNAPMIDQSYLQQVTGDQKSGDRLMERLLGEFVKTQRSLVIELHLPTRAERTDLAKHLRKAGYVPLFVWVQVDIDTAMSRTFKNIRMSENDYLADMKRFSVPHQSESVVVISGKHTFATQAKAILKKLSTPRPTTRPAERQQPARGQIIVR